MLSVAKALPAERQHIVTTVPLRVSRGAAARTHRAILDDLVGTSAALGEYGGRYFIEGRHAVPEVVDELTRVRLITLLGMAAGMVLGLRAVCHVGDPDVLAERVREACGDHAIQKIRGANIPHPAAWTAIRLYFGQFLEQEAVLSAGLRAMLQEELRAERAAGILCLAAELPILNGRPRTRRFCELLVNRHVVRRRPTGNRFQGAEYVRHCERGDTEDAYRLGAVQASMATAQQSGGGVS